MFKNGMRACRHQRHDLHPKKKKEKEEMSGKFCTTALRPLFSLDLVLRTQIRRGDGDMSSNIRRVKPPMAADANKQEGSMLFF
jgi:hypothetical protein